MINDVSEVLVSGGRFIAHTYEVDDGHHSRGVKIVVEFQPRHDIGQDGDTISLVQTVRDRMTMIRFGKDDPSTGTDITPQPTTSQLGHRKLTLADSAVTDEEIGTGIDQTVLSQDGKQVINLDPRYTEMNRMSEQQALNVRGLNSMDPRSARSAKKTDGTWSSAVLNDTPELTPPGPAAMADATVITGSMEFEIAALLNGEHKFLGSVIWGWKTEGGDSELSPDKLALGNAQTATPRFFKAAKKWNRTEIVDPTTGQRHTPLQLPTQ